MNLPQITDSERKDLGRYMRQDLLYRLKRDVFGVLEHIEIAAGALGQEDLIPLFGSPYATEHNHLEIHIGQLISK